MSSPKVEAWIDRSMNEKPREMVTVTCPILSITGYHDRGDPIRCDGDGCTWWNDTKCECLVVTMVGAIDGLSSLVENLTTAEREEQQ